MKPQTKYYPAQQCYITRIAWGFPEGTGATPEESKADYKMVMLRNRQNYNKQNRGK